jgi:hypothetical protein
MEGLLRGEPCRSTRSASQRKIDSESLLRNYAIPGLNSHPIIDNNIELDILYVKSDWFVKQIKLFFSANNSTIYAHSGALREIISEIASQIMNEFRIRSTGRS